MRRTGRVDDVGESGPGAGLDDLLDAGADGAREVPDHREDGEPAENAGARVEQRDHHRVPARDQCQWSGRPQSTNQLNSIQFNSTQLEAH